MRPIDADVLLDTIRRDSKKAIDEGDKVGSFWLGYTAGSVIAQPTIQPVATDTNVGDTISKFIDGLEEIFTDLRERHVDDSVCGLCEYDGAYMGQSGNWCNECPGFDRDDCFKLSDKTRKEWTEEIIKALPTVQPEKAQLSKEGATSDLISRQAAIDALSLGKEMLSRVLDDIDVVGTVREKYSWGLGLIESYINDINELPSAQPEHKVRFADKDHVWIDGKQYISLPRFQEAVKEAQPKEGHWIEVAGELECSECHTVFTDLYPDYADSVACPHCGTKMRGGQNG